MSDLDLTVGACRIRMTYSAPLSVNHFNSLVSTSHAMSTALALDWAKLEITAPNVYDYRIRLQDSRMWRQTLTFSGAIDADPSMTFTVQPGWLLSEFTAQREWRAEVISLRNAVGATLIRLDHV